MIVPAYSVFDTTCIFGPGGTSPTELASRDDTKNQIVLPQVYAPRGAAGAGPRELADGKEPSGDARWAKSPRWPGRPAARRAATGAPAGAAPAAAGRPLRLGVTRRLPRPTRTTRSRDFTYEMRTLVVTRILKMYG